MLADVTAYRLRLKQTKVFYVLIQTIITKMINGTDVTPLLPIFLQIFKILASRKGILYFLNLLCYSDKNCFKTLSVCVLVYNI